MSIQERIANLETHVEWLIAKTNNLADYEVQILFLLLGGVAAIAFLFLKK